MMTRKTLAAMAAGAALLAPATARGQELREGERVRVTVPGHRPERLAGVVVPSPADSVLLRMGDTVVAVPRRQVTRVEVASGAGRRQTVKGMLIGFGAGAVIGGVVGGTCTDPECPVHPGLIVGGVGAGAGLLVGAAVGSLFHEQTWTEAPVSGAALSVAPARRGHAVSLGLSLTTR